MSIVDDHPTMRLPHRDRLDVDRVAEMHAILRSATADPETMQAVIAELRAEATEGLRLQTEVDGVIARYRAAHPRRVERR